jgi:hypothetical protein
MHVLMREARSAPIREAMPPVDAHYDVVAGVWRDASGLLAYP